MGWFITADTGEFLAVAGEYLRAEPARNTVVLTVTEDLRVRTAPPSQAARSQGVRSQDAQSQGASAGAGLDEPLFGWWRPPARPGGESAGPVGAVCMHTPTFPILLSQVSWQAAAELACDLATAGRELSGVSAAEDAADAFASAWQDRTGDTITVYRRMRLFRLAELIPPEPGPEGTARLATERDRDLLAAWFDAFAREVGDPPRHDNRALVDGRLGHGGITVWEADGAPVSVAGLTRTVAGMVRVGPVYTPPELRGRGYAGAATAAVSQAALAAGLRDVVLYTDLANPTSNALYQRLGYRPVEDRVIFSFTPAATGYASPVSGLEGFAELVDGDHGLCVVSTLRSDGTIQSSVVNAGVLPHPVTGVQVVGLVSRGDALRLANLRARPRATVVIRAGWHWSAVEGQVELAGPDDPMPGVDAERLRLLLREIFTAAGGTHDDFDTYDRVMADERRVAVLVTPARISANRPG